MALTIKKALKYVLLSVAIPLQLWMSMSWMFVIIVSFGLAIHTHETELAISLLEYINSFFIIEGLYVIWALEYIMVLRATGYHRKQPKWFVWVCPVLLPLPVIQIRILLRIIFRCIPDIYLYTY